MAQDPANLPADQLADLASVTAAAKQLGLDMARVDASSPEPAALKLIAKPLALEHRLVPLKLDGKSLYVAVSDPSLLTKPAPAFLQELKAQGYVLKLFLTPAADFTAAVTAYDAPAPVPAAPEPAGIPAAPATVPPVAPAVPTPAPVPAPAAPPVMPSVPAAVPTPPAPAAPVPVPASVISSQIPAVDLMTRQIPKATLERFPEDVATKYQIVVFELSADGKEASVAAVKPDDQRIRDILKYVEERNAIRIHLYRTDPKGFAAALKGYQVGVLAPKPSVAPAPAPVPASAPVPLARASADKIAAVAAKPMAAVPPKPTAPLPPVPPAAVPQPAPIGGTMPAPGAVPAPVRPATPATPAPTPAQPKPLPAAQQPASDDTTPTITLAELQSQVGLAVNTDTESGQAAMAQLVSGDEQANLDQTLGTPVNDFAAFETVMKTGLIPKIVAAIVYYASVLLASDIHIEPSETALRVRFRIDGKLRNVVKLPVELHAPLTSRIKILSKLKIDENRLPQDGRFNVQVASHQVDLRVSTLPTIHGEKVVIRLLDKTAGVKQLSALGLNGMNLKRVSEAVTKPYGIILVTGPTGSGKSTTLYAMLTEINRPDVNIITLEDPVEYQVEGINQTQVKPAIGYTFADGLRSILRQDPNVIMVGEIRDSETAGLATQAALTGHLVLSTLHTNNAAGAIPRLIDMDVEPFLIASSLDIIIAQRLVRRLCEQCKVPVTPPAEILAEITKELDQSPVAELKNLAKRPMAFYGPKGCDQCADGYQGRLGIYEVIAMSESIAQLAIKEASGSVIEETARKEGMMSMRQDGILKALEGQTSIDEILQATSE